MSISAEEVKKVASLARINLSPPEVAKFQTELSAITNYNATQLALIKKKSSPSRSVSPGFGQEDRARPSLSQDLALGNAPEEENGLFVVPKLLGES